MDNPPDDGPCEVTITAPDREWLQAFVRQLVEDRLAAAAHVDTMQTVYRWAGEVKFGEEARARLHTRFNHVPGIYDRLNATHEFEVPSLTATRIDTGSEEYLRWIVEST